jgi:hypothetical protein
MLLSNRLCMKPRRNSCGCCTMRATAEDMTATASPPLPAEGAAPEPVFSAQFDLTMM